MSTYNKTTWNNDAPPALNATNLNKIEQGVADAHSELAASLDPVTGHKHTGVAGDGPQIDPSAFNTAAWPAFRAYQSVLQSIAAGTYTAALYQTEVYDQGNIYDTATSTFTAPASGFYLVTAQMHWAQGLAGERYIATLYVNGTEHSRLDDKMLGGTDNSSSGGSVVLKLAAGDSVRVFLYTSSARDTTPGIVSGYFSAVRVA